MVDGTASLAEQMAYKVATGKKLTIAEMNKLDRDHDAIVQLGKMLGTRVANLNYTELAATLNSTAVKNAKGNANLPKLEEQYQQRVAELEAAREQAAKKNETISTLEYDINTDRQDIAVQNKVLNDFAQGNIIKAVSSDGMRNEKSLTDEQINECIEYAQRLGFNDDISYSEYSNTAFVGSVEGDRYCRLVVGTDVFAAEAVYDAKTPNRFISEKGAIAHEVVGHYEAWLRGFVCEDPNIEEAQASIRAARFAAELTYHDRVLLIRDALMRLKKSNIPLSKARKLMKIESR